MGVLSELQPVNVFKYFEEICSIPHPSYKEEQISNYLVTFAKERGLEYYQDDVFNVIIIKEASEGYEDVEPLIIQGHMDMVAEKVNGCDKDMNCEGLDLAIDGDYVFAKGTTLGGDDGIALAYALAILDDDSIKHPRLEVVCTVCEEVGLEGASHIDVSMLQGKKLLNIDSEEEGVFLTSCAGGCCVEVLDTFDLENVNGTRIKISISNLTGGHSGVEINRGRANAHLLLGRILRDLDDEADFNLLSVKGGKKDNAIPRECIAELIVTNSIEAVTATFNKTVNEIKEEYSATDPDMDVSVEWIGEVESLALSYKDTKKVIALVQALPANVIRMSQDIEGLVETSLNMGIMSVVDGEMKLGFSVRSSIDTAKQDLIDRLKYISEAFGAKVKIYGNYPAWEYKKDSSLREDMVNIYEKMYGTTPKLEAIHAGLECGIFCGKKDFDCVSFGPNVIDIHTPDEKLSISSTKRVYEFLLNVIECK